MIAMMFMQTDMQNWARLGEMLLPAAQFVWTIVQRYLFNEDYCESMVNNGYSWYISVAAIVIWQVIKHGMTFCALMGPSKFSTTIWIVLIAIRGVIYIREDMGSQQSFEAKRNKDVQAFSDLLDRRTKEALLMQQRLGNEHQTLINNHKLEQQQLEKERKLEQQKRDEEYKLEQQKRDEEYKLEQQKRDEDHNRKHQELLDELRNLREERLANQMINGGSVNPTALSQTMMAQAVYQSITSNMNNIVKKSFAQMIDNPPRGYVNKSRTVVDNADVEYWCPPDKME